MMQYNKKRKRKLKIGDKVRILDKTTGQSIDSIMYIDVLKEIGKIIGFCKMSHRFRYMVIFKGLTESHWYKFNETDLRLHTSDFITLEEFQI